MRHLQRSKAILYDWLQIIYAMPIEVGKNTRILQIVQLNKKFIKF